MNKLSLTLILLCVFSTFTIKSIQAQEIKWRAVLSGGLTDMRNLTDGMEATGYGFVDAEGNMSAYKLRNKPDYMISAGIAASGNITKEGVLGWDAQLLIRNGGFRIFVDADGKQAAEEPGNGLPAAQFGKTKAFRYWSLHLPLSLTYSPFEVVGFTIGTDLYYQLSADPSKNTEGNFSPLDKHIGLSPHPNFTDYSHPFNLGAHVGVFLPVGDRLRFDAQVFTDLGSRLRFQRQQSEQSHSDHKYREMGLSLSVAYKLDW